MNYYADYKDGRLIALGIGAGSTPISKEEYDALLSELLEKISLAARLADGQISESALPPAWREEILSRAEEIRSSRGEE